MENGKPKGTGFAIVNICAGVILTMSGAIMLFDPSTGPAGFIAAPLGLVIFFIGCFALNTLKNHPDDFAKIKNARLINTVAFIISCLILGACVTLPLIAPLIG